MFIKCVAVIGVGRQSVDRLNFAHTRGHKSIFNRRYTVAYQKSCLCEHYIVLRIKAIMKSVWFENVTLHRPSRGIFILIQINHFMIIIIIKMHASTLKFVINAVILFGSFTRAVYVVRDIFNHIDYITKCILLSVFEVLNCVNFKSICDTIFCLVSNFQSASLYDSNRRHCIN